MPKLRETACCGAAAVCSRAAGSGEGPTPVGGGSDPSSADELPVGVCRTVGADEGCSEVMDLGMGARLESADAREADLPSRVTPLLHIQVTHQMQPHALLTSRWHQTGNSILHGRTSAELCSNCP